MRILFAALPVATLAACVSMPPTTPVEVQILAFNDFHGNLEVPAPVELTEPNGSRVKIGAGGAARLAARLADLRRSAPFSVTVSAGDTIGATPLTSALFLDEPTIEAMNMIGLEFNAVGNHEFDKGVAELKRMQEGGCAKFTARTPCAIAPFKGGRFRYLAANVVQPDGTTVFPATAIKRFETPSGPISIGFIGMTLAATRTLVTPTGVAGLDFTEEAATANALVPTLKAQGANAIVLLIHQGGKLPTLDRGNGCDGLYGEILPILEKLDPSITAIVSGHTHWAYVCAGGAGGAPRHQLVTSASKNGYMVTDIRLTFDRRSHALIGQRATNSLVDQSGEDPAVAAHVATYVAAASPLANRVVGSLTAAAERSLVEAESPAADMVADSMLAATRDKAKGGAQMALVNVGGVRVDLPAGSILYRHAFAMMPFANNLVVMSLSGAELKEALEQQAATPFKAGVDRPAVLAPSAGFTYTIDISRPVGSRVVAMHLDGKPIDPAATYRVVVNNYTASGGDGLAAFTKGRDRYDPGIVDIDALIAWIEKGRTPPAPNRISYID